MANMQGQNDTLGRQFDAVNDTNRFNAQEANDTAQFNSNLGVDTAQAYGNLSSSLGGLLNNAGQLDINRLGASGTLADQQRAIELANSPYGQALMQAGLLNGDGLLALTTGQTGTTNGTQTQKTSGGLGSQLLGGMFTLGSAAIGKYSERRVKSDIVKIGEDSDGLGWYNFRYVWDANSAPLNTGTMVDEVERLRPWALGPVINGIKTVDYSKLEAR